MVLAPALAFAQGALEIPGKDSYQSGIGVISGWHCTAQRIEISIDLGAPILVSSHTPRQDTAGVCGRADTGFAMAFNWNILEATQCCEIGSRRQHRLMVFADGVPFADTLFYSKKFNTEYLRGARGVYELRNFPGPDVRTDIYWDEEKQNFSIYYSNESFEPTYPVPTGQLGGTGLYYGAIDSHACGASTTTTRYAKFMVTTTNGRMQAKVEYADGNICELPPVAVDLSTNSDGYLKATFDQNATAACATFAGGALTLYANGRTLMGRGGSCESPTLTGITMYPSLLVSSPVR